jgi:hypothetical protein
MKTKENRNLWLLERVFFIHFLHPIYMQNISTSNVITFDFLLFFDLSKREDVISRNFASCYWKRTYRYVMNITTFGEQEKAGNSIVFMKH